MNQTQIDNLKKLLAEATPAKPWTLEHDTDGSEVVDAKNYSVARWDYALLAGGEANAALIVAAVNALPDLLAERERLREALQRLLDVPEPMTTTEHFDYNANATRLARAALAESEGE